MNATVPKPRCLLFDNGSLRPEATRTLRRVARRLETALGADVQPVSLLHSAAVDPAQLDGVRPQLLESALRTRLESGDRDLVLLPLFFGPSAALTDYLPRRLEPLRRQHPDARIRVGRWLVEPREPGDRRIAAILADRVRTVGEAHGLRRPRVVLVDHGSPQRAVTEVRNHLGRQVGRLLATEIRSLAVASMERRPGPAYAFAGPLLAGILDRPDYTEGPVVVALQFLLPGRHAGPDGDVAAICAAAERKRPGLRLHTTELVGDHPGLTDVLADRYREAIAPP